MSSMLMKKYNLRTHYICIMQQIIYNNVIFHFFDAVNINEIRDRSKMREESLS